MEDLALLFFGSWRFIFSPNFRKDYLKYLDTLGKLSLAWELLAALLSFILGVGVPIWLSYFFIFEYAPN